MDESAHHALANAGGREIVGKKEGEQKGSARGSVYWGCYYATALDIEVDPQRGTREEPGTLTQGAPVFPGSSRLGIEPKTPGGWCKTQLVTCDYTVDHQNWFLLFSNFKHGLVNFFCLVRGNGIGPDAGGRDGLRRRGRVVDAAGHGVISRGWERRPPVGSRDGRRRAGSG